MCYTISMKKILIILLIPFLLGGDWEPSKLSEAEKKDKFGYVQRAEGVDYYDFEIAITSIPVTAIVEINEEYVGRTPFIRTYDGFRYDSNDLIIRATPEFPGYYVQTKVLKGNHILPKCIVFDMTLKTDTIKER